MDKEPVNPLSELDELWKPSDALFNATVQAGVTFMKSAHHRRTLEREIK